MNLNMVTPPEIEAGEERCQKGFDAAMAEAERYRNLTAVSAERQKDGQFRRLMQEGCG
ncbi:MAG: hypothetical protein V8T36_11130 [Ruthenibacterium lactatiformans]